MDWSAIGAIGEIVGGLGVIITLLYLSSQIRQNNRQIQGNAIGTLAELTYGLTADIREDTGLFRIAARGAVDWESNSPDDQNRLHILNFQEMQILETAFHLWQQQAIPENLYLAREEYMLRRLSEPGTQYWWENHECGQKDEGLPFRRWKKFPGRSHNRWHENDCQHNQPRYSDFFNPLNSLHTKPDVVITGQKYQTYHGSLH